MSTFATSTLLFAATARADGDHAHNTADKGVASAENTNIAAAYDIRYIHMHRYQKTTRADGHNGHGEGEVIMHMNTTGDISTEINKAYAFVLNLGEVKLKDGNGALTPAENQTVRADGFKDRLIVMAEPVADAEGTKAWEGAWALLEEDKTCTGSERRIAYPTDKATQPMDLKPVVDTQKKNKITVPVPFANDTDLAGLWYDGATMELATATKQDDQRQLTTRCVASMVDTGSTDLSLPGRFFEAPTTPAPTSGSADGGTVDGESTEGIVVNSGATSVAGVAAAVAFLLQFLM